MVLTGKNKKVYDYVKAAQREHPQGMPPSLREIAKACGLGEVKGSEGRAGSAAAAQYHMLKLVKMGLAEATGDKARKYRVIDVHAEMAVLQRAARDYRPEQVFAVEVLKDWARRAGFWTGRSEL